MTTTPLRDQPRPSPSARFDSTPAAHRYALSGVIVCAVGAWVLWRTGPSEVPNLDGFAAVAGDWPSTTIDSGFAYTLRVPLGQMVYRLLPEQDPTTFFVLHAGCLLVVAALIGFWLCQRIGAHRGMLAGCILLLAPITPVLVLWVGMYDAFSMLAWTLLVMSFNRGWRLQFAAAALAGFQNFEQSVVGMLVLLLVPALVRGAAWEPRALAVFGGLAAGKVFLELILSEAGASSGDRIAYLLDDGKGVDLLAAAAPALPMLLWSALGGLWIFAILGLRDAWRTWSRHSKAMLAAAFGIWILSGVLAEDQTRVFALTSFPAVMAGAIILASRYRDVVRFAGQPSAWLLVIAPPVVLWNNGFVAFADGPQEGADLHLEGVGS